MAAIICKTCGSVGESSLAAIHCHGCYIKLSQEVERLKAMALKFNICPVCEEWVEDCTCKITTDTPNSRIPKVFRNRGT